MIEEQANVIFRRRTRTASGSKEEKPKRQYQNNSGSEGDRKPPKTAKPAGEAPKTSRWHKKPGMARNDANKAHITCYRCNNTGHYADKCPEAQPEDAGGSARKDRTGKGPAGKVNGSKD
jgi:hypothetical protein